MSDDPAAPSAVLVDARSTRDLDLIERIVARGRSSTDPSTSTVEHLFG